MKKWIWLVVILLVLGIGYWVARELTKPLPGQEVKDDGREHVTDIYGVKYSSNPPTSGKHFPVWAKPGVYDRLVSDGYLLHSMEHGYVVIWYDCSKLSSGGLIKTVFAHDEPTQESTESGQLLMHMKVQPTGNMSWFTPENPPEVEIELPESFKTDSCKSLVNQLSEFTKVAKRVIVTPRLNMDSAVAITAWGKIDKMDSLDAKRITDFIKAYHNRGPEQTTE
ncbi:MAG: DUF3105 domain-containing protein [Patescibacteria group bacterium]